MRQERKRYPSTYYSPCHVHDILGNGGIKKVIEEAESKLERKMSYILTRQFELLIMPRGRKRLYDPETLQLRDKK